MAAQPGRPSPKVNSQSHNGLSFCATSSPFLFASTLQAASIPYDDILTDIRKGMRSLSKEAPGATRTPYRRASPTQDMCHRTSKPHPLISHSRAVLELYIHSHKLTRYPLKLAACHAFHNVHRHRSFFICSKDLVNQNHIVHCPWQYSPWHLLELPHC